MSLSTENRAASSVKGRTESSISGRGRTGNRTKSSARGRIGNRSESSARRSTGSRTRNTAMRGRVIALTICCFTPVILLACIFGSNPDQIARLEGRAYRACATSTPPPTLPPPPPGPVTFTAIRKVGWSASADNFQAGTGNEPSNAIDGDPNSFWHTEFFNPSPPAHPHRLDVSLGGTFTMTMVAYTPKQLDPNGRIGNYTIYTSGDGSSWDLATSGSFSNGTATEYATFPEVTASHVRIVAHSDVTGGPWTAIGELDVGYGVSAPLLPVATPAPAETPYYQVGRFYLYQTALIDGIGIRLSNYETTLHPEPTRGRMHYLTWDVTNFSNRPLVVPMTQFVFISEVRGENKLIRGQWHNKGDVLTIGDFPDVYELDDTPIDPGQTRTITLGILTPNGVVGEVGVMTDWGRPVEFGAPIWFLLEEDLTPCEHGEVVHPPPPTPTEPFAALITPQPPIGVGGPITPVIGSGVAIPPAVGAVTHGFGCRLTITGLLDPGVCDPGEELHDGIDIANLMNQPIIAPITGTVIFAGADTGLPDCSGLIGSQPPHLGYGNYIVVDSPSYGQRHLMAHLSSFVVTSGAVNQGDVIGYMGSTGCSTGSHTHWNCTIGGTAVDPNSC
jgi:hypothetical protein